MIWCIVISIWLQPPFGFAIQDPLKTMEEFLPKPLPLPPKAQAVQSEETGSTTTTQVPNTVDYQPISTDKLPLDLMSLLETAPDAGGSRVYTNVSIVNAYLKHEEDGRSYVVDSVLTSCERRPSGVLYDCHTEGCSVAVRWRGGGGDGSSSSAAPVLTGMRCSSPSLLCEACESEDECDRQNSAGHYCQMPKGPDARCFAEFSTVASHSVAIRKGCGAPDSEVESYSCTDLGEIGHLSRCTCVGSLCNSRDRPDQELTTDVSLVNNVNRSIRQLRADVKRMIKEQLQANCGN